MAFWAVVWVGVAIGVGVEDGVGVTVGEGLSVGEGMGVGVAVAPGVGLREGVGVIVALRVGLGVGVGDGGGVGVAVGVGEVIGVGGLRVHPAMDNASAPRINAYLRDNIVLPNCASSVRPDNLDGADEDKQIYHRVISTQCSESLAPASCQPLA